MSSPPTKNREAGAVVPIFALLIVVLLIFSAFAVDLGAAWAERREAQTAADAGAMAGALAESDIITDAIDFVERNVGDPSALNWASCPVPDPDLSSFTDDAGDTVNFQLVDAGRTNCVWIGSTDTATNETFVGVRTPNLAIDTAFAQLIGIDTIDVDAFAISRLVKRGPARILPFAVASGSPDHVCLGSAPPGIADNPCSGGTNANRGYLQSPHHGDAELGTSDSCDGQPNSLVVLEDNIALGTDHPIVPDDTYDDAQPWNAPVNVAADDDRADECVSNAPPPHVPNSVVFYPGNPEDQLHVGLVSNQSFYGSPSRLQHPLSIPTGGTSIPPTRTIDNKNTGSFVLDNIGLWDYISDSSTGQCNPNHPNNIGPWNTGGPAATARLLACLGFANNTTDKLVFDTELLDSPRFAIVPELWGQFPPSQNPHRAIHQFRAVYIQSIWFNCNGTDTVDACLPFVAIDGTTVMPQFSPGEGEDAACEPQNANPNSGCKNSQARGLTALLLPVEASPSGVIDLGPDSDQPFVAELVR